jgi:hypothetical protein
MTHVLHRLLSQLNRNLGVESKANPLHGKQHALLSKYPFITQLKEAVECTVRLNGGETNTWTLYHGHEPPICVVGEWFMTCTTTDAEVSKMMREMPNETSIIRITGARWGLGTNKYLPNARITDPVRLTLSTHTHLDFTWNGDLAHPTVEPFLECDETIIQKLKTAFPQACIVQHYKSEKMRGEHCYGVYYVDFLLFYYQHGEY